MHKPLRSQKFYFLHENRKPKLNNINRGNMENEKITPEKLRVLAELAGITLTEDRIKELLPHVNELQSKIHSLDDLDLENIEPITRFMADQE